MHPDDVRRDFALLRRAHVSGYVASPHLLTIHPTDVCNHHCQWCWFDRTSDAVNMCDSVRLTNHLAQATLQEVIVSGGGEPLLHPNVQMLCAALLEHPNLHRRLYTNGTAFHLAEDLHNAFDYIRVSIDSGDANVYANLHGTRPDEFHRIFARLAELSATSCAVGVSMVLTIDNIHTVEALIQRCLLEGIRYIFLKPVMDGMARIELPCIVRSYSDADIQVYVRTGSGVGEVPAPSPSVAKLSVTLTADNYVRPCCHLTSDEWRICAVADIESTDLFTEQHGKIAARYADYPHACRLHDAWQAWWPIFQKRTRATHAIAQRLGESWPQGEVEVAARIAAAIRAEELEAVGITGPSAVGKTTVANEIASTLTAMGLRPMRVTADDFVRKELRGAHEYRKHADQPLTPSDFDFGEMAHTIRRLREGETVEWLGYERGVGWVDHKFATPGDVLIVDGLFLDEANVIDLLNLDLTTVIEAPVEAIASWRRERDASIRSRSGGTYRTESETENEILRTIASYRQYSHARRHESVLLIELDLNHVVRRAHAAT